MREKNKDMQKRNCKKKKKNLLLIHAKTVQCVYRQ
jgi:hypothetical protein